jgi:hypothetical protein
VGSLARGQPGATVQLHDHSDLDAAAQPKVRASLRQRDRPVKIVSGDD